MWANYVIRFSVRILHVPLNIVCVATTFVGGMILAIPLVGLVFALTLDLVGICLTHVLIWTAWLWHRAPLPAQPIIAIIGVPVAVIGDAFLTLTPGGPTRDALFIKYTRQALCQEWPYGRANLSEIQAEEHVGFSRAVLKLGIAFTEQKLGWSPFWPSGGPGAGP
jgi:hypothetical protein